MKKMILLKFPRVDLVIDLKGYFSKCSILPELSLLVTSGQRYYKNS